MERVSEKLRVSFVNEKAPALMIQYESERK